MPHPTAVSPRDFAAVLSAGDIERAAACFARDGCLVTPDGTAVHGRDRIRSVLEQMVLCHTRIDVELSNSLTSGEVMLVRERWRVRIGEDGAQLERTLHPTLVLRRIEATWKLAVAVPWQAPAQP